MNRKYNGKIEWHTDEPPKSGIYIVSCNGWVGEKKYFKNTKEWESYNESENGGYQRNKFVDAWAYLPEPYCK